MKPSVHYVGLFICLSLLFFHFIVDIHSYMCAFSSPFEIKIVFIIFFANMKTLIFTYIFVHRP